MNRRAILLTLEVVTPIAIIALLWVLTSDSGSYYFPPLKDMLSNLIHTWLANRLHSDILPSIVRLLLGFALAVVVGIVGGVVLGLVPWLRRSTGPLIDFLRSIPPPALIPFSIVVLGVGGVAKVLLIALVSVWPILLNTVDGVAGIEPILTDTNAVYRISPADRLLRVVLPAASPQIFAGLRTSLSLSVILMVISEMVAGTDGVGYQILYAQRTFAIPTMWGGIILLGILGYLLNFVLILVEHRALRWHRSSRQHAA